MVSGQWHFLFVRIIRPCHARTNAPKNAILSRWFVGDIRDGLGHLLPHPCPDADLCWRFTRLLSQMRCNDSSEYHCDHWLRLPAHSLGFNLFTCNRPTFRGCSSICRFLGVLYLASVWFHKERLSLVSGLTVVLGFFGAILAIKWMLHFANVFTWKSAGLARAFCPDDLSSSRESICNEWSQKHARFPCQLGHDIFRILSRHLRADDPIDGGRNRSSDRYLKNPELKCIITLCSSSRLHMISTEESHVGGDLIQRAIEVQ
jgi:hypothetical protein